MNPIPAGPCSDRDDRVSDAFGTRPNHLVLTQYPHAHRIDERVAGIGIVEHDLAGHRWNPDAIPVVPNPADDPREEVAHPRAVERSKTERVQQRDRPRSHGEDVAENPADA